MPSCHGMVPLKFFKFKFRKADRLFSPLGEIRADAILPINRFMAFRLGYTGIIAGGMSIPNPIVVYPVPDAGVANVDHVDAVYISAFTAGLQINR